MKSLRLPLGLFAILALVHPLAVHAASTLPLRTWVSGTGSDSNACTRTAPCATWNGAIAKTAYWGEVDALDPGDFGNLLIFQPITIDGGGGQVSSILATSDNSAVLVEAGLTAVVTIRNLRLQGANLADTYGVYFYSAATLHIEHCVIAGMSGYGIYIAPTNQPTAGAQVFIEDTTVQDTTGDGLYIKGGSAANVHVTVSNSRFTGNSEYGLWAADYSRVTVRNSESSGNGNAGYLANAGNGTTILSMIDSVATNNGAGGLIAGGSAGISAVRIANMGIFNNVFGYSTQPNGSIVSFGNNNNSGSGAPTGSIPQD